MRIKREHRASQRCGLGSYYKRMKERKSERWRTRDSYTPPQRTWAGARALPDAAVAVSACGLHIVGGRKRQRESVCAILISVWFEGILFINK